MIAPLDPAAPMTVKVTLATLTLVPCCEAKGGCRMLFMSTLVALPLALQTKVRLLAGQSDPGAQLDSLAMERTVGG